MVRKAWQASSPYLEIVLYAVILLMVPFWYVVIGFVCMAFVEGVSGASMNIIESLRSAFFWPVIAGRVAGKMLSKHINEWLEKSI